MDVEDVTSDLGESRASGGCSRGRRSGLGPVGVGAGACLSSEKSCAARGRRWNGRLGRRKGGFFFFAWESLEHVARPKRLRRGRRDEREWRTDALNRRSRLGGLGYNRKQGEER